MILLSMGMYLRIFIDGGMFNYVHTYNPPFYMYILYKKFSKKPVQARGEREENFSKGLFAAFLPPEFQTGGKIGDMKHRIKQKSCFILDRLMI